MEKPFLVVVLINIIYAGMSLLSKAAFNHGVNTYVFVLYRQATATVFLAPVAVFAERKTTKPLTLIILFKIFMLALLGITFSLNMFNVALRYTSATVASAVTNSVPVITFFFAVILGMETFKLSTHSGSAKFLGIGLCMGGVMVIAFYTGPIFNSHILSIRSFSERDPHISSKTDWIKGTFFMIIANTSWSLWMVLQGWILAEYPSKLLFTALQCLLSTVQSFCVAVAMERDFSKWKLGLNVELLAVLYCGVVVTGVSFYLQAWIIQKKGPVFLAVSLPLTLIFTIALSFLLGQSVNLGSILGGAAMVGGLYSVMWGKSREQNEANVPVVENDEELASEIKETPLPLHPL